VGVGVGVGEGIGVGEEELSIGGLEEGNVIWEKQNGNCI